MSWVKRQVVRAYQRRVGAVRTLNELEGLQWRDSAELRALQGERLGALLRYAARHVPFYREALREAGVVGADGSVHAGRFADLPPLDKQTIRARFDDLASDELAARRWSVASSGGSTGRPVRVIRDHAGGAELAVFELFNSWAGQRLGDRHVVLWGASRWNTGDCEARPSPRARLVKWLHNYALLDSYSVTPAKLCDHVARINACRPHYLQGYADFLYYLARFVEREGLAVHRPASIACTATPVYAHMREVVERVFGAPMFDRYGSGEVGLVAAQCERRSGLHVCVPTHLVEILRADGTTAGPDEVGEIVVTPLLNLAMPLLRYRTEDLGAWASEGCGCGRAWPMISTVVGRAIDVFVTRDGRLVSGGLFIKLVDEVNFANGDLVDRYQIVQEDLDRVVVRLVSRSGDPESLPPALVEGLRAGVAAMFPDGVDVSVEFPASIEATPSGKFRFAMSRVPRRAADHSDLFQV